MIEAKEVQFEKLSYKKVEKEYIDSDEKDFLGIKDVNEMNSHKLIK